MPEMTIEDNIGKLEKETAILKLRIERAQAVNACANLMDKYQYYHMRGMRTEETRLFALKTPGARVEMLWGIYDEPEGILRWMREEGYGKQRQIGMLNLHCMTTPIIEVAKDGETAKGMWLMIGTETFKPPEVKEMQANWACGHFAMDFIKEDGEWKIWKYSTAGGIFAPFEEGWARANRTRAELEAEIDLALSGKGDRRPDRAPTYPWMWNKGEWHENVPPVPLPYENWDDSLACIPAPGEKRNFRKK